MRNKKTRQAQRLDALIEAFKGVMDRVIFNVFQDEGKAYYEAIIQ